MGNFKSLNGTCARIQGMSNRCNRCSTSGVNELDNIYSQLANLCFTAKSYSTFPGPGSSYDAEIKLVRVTDSEKCNCGAYSITVSVFSLKEFATESLSLISISSI